MRISSFEKNGCAVFRIEGSVELFTADIIMEKLYGTIEEKGFTRVVLDFTEVDYLDSAGLKALILMLKKCSDRVKIRLCGLQSGVARLFEVTNMARFMPVDPSLDTSIRELNS